MVEYDQFGRRATSPISTTPEDLNLSAIINDLKTKWEDLYKRVMYVMINEHEREIGA